MARRGSSRPPLRDAKLTRLLSGALGADPIRTHLLLLASTSREHAEVTAEVLSFGGLARLAKLRPQVYLLTLTLALTLTPNPTPTLNLPTRTTKPTCQPVPLPLTYRCTSLPRRAPSALSCRRTLRRSRPLATRRARRCSTR